MCEMVVRTLAYEVCKMLLSVCSLCEKNVKLGVLSLVIQLLNDISWSMNFLWTVCNKEVFWHMMTPLGIFSDSCSAWSRIQLIV